MSYGTYDFHGRDDFSAESEPSSSEDQLFFTAGSREEFWNVTAGVAYYPGGKARATSVCGHRWMPLVPVADNGSFALDLGF
jgi:hypothetical protein